MTGTPFHTLFVLYVLIHNNFIHRVIHSSSHNATPLEEPIVADSLTMKYHYNVKTGHSAIS